ncbi:MAG: hypothetical protein ACRC11_15625 [Xenococcaceae cyanobacterium]
MASFDIFNLKPSGSDLFEDNDSFLADLNEQESSDINGGSYECYSYYDSFSFDFSFNFDNAPKQQQDAIIKSIAPAPSAIVAVTYAGDLGGSGEGF